MIEKKIKNNNLLLNLLFQSKNIYGEPLKNLDKNLKPFIYGKRDNYSIINIRKVSFVIKRVFKLLESVLKKNEKILIIGNSEDISFLVNKRFTKNKKNIIFFDESWVNGLITNNINKDITSFLEKKEIKLIFILKSSLNENFLKKELSMYQVPIISLLNTSQNIKNINYPIVSTTANIKSVYILMYLLRKLF